jgi:hypothetical protein
MTQPAIAAGTSEGFAHSAMDATARRNAAVKGKNAVPDDARDHRDVSLKLHL